MSNISKCENCGCEKIDVIHKYKGYYACPKCGRDTERLYEIEHDAEIRAKAIDEFTKAITAKLPSVENDEKVSKMACVRDMIFLVDGIAEQMKAGGENE